MKFRLVIGLLGLHIAFTSGCSKPEAPPTPEVSVEIVQASQGEITEHITADSVLAPVAQAAIAPKISAPVRTFYVKRGAKVKQGQLLAVLENRDLEAVALDNSGSYAQAKAAYEAATKGSVPEDFQKAELDVAQAKANLDVQQKIYDARKDLFDQGAIAGREFETAKAGLVQAQAAFDIAEKHLKSQTAVGRQAALESAKGQLDSAKGKYQGAQAGLSYSEIRSPIDGVVTDRSLFAGEMASSGQPLLTVMDISSLIAKTHLSQAQVQQMKVGTEADLKVQGEEKPFAGTVSLISPALDPGSTTVEVWVKVSNKKARLKPGTPAQVSITTQTVKDAVTVPNAAVVTDATGKKLLMVVGSDSIAHQRTVEIGVSDGDKTQIVSGLKAGEQVVAAGAYAMDDGTKVKAAAAGDDKGDDKGEKGGDKKPEAGKPEAKD